MGKGQFAVGFLHMLLGIAYFMIGLHAVFLGHFEVTSTDNRTGLKEARGQYGACCGDS
jgi:hypothetical protein